MKDADRIRSLFVRRVSPLEVPQHVKVRTRPGRPLIREYSWHLKPRVRALLGTVNVLIWAVWLLLLGVVMTSLAWSIGVWMLQHEWIEAEGIRGLARFVENELPLGLGFCLVFLLWASVRAWSMRRLKVARRLAQRVAADQAGAAPGEPAPSPRRTWTGNSSGHSCTSASCATTTRVVICNRWKCASCARRRRCAAHRSKNASDP